MPIFRSHTDDELIPITRPLRDDCDRRRHPRNWRGICCVLRLEQSRGSRSHRLLTHPLGSNEPTTRLPVPNGSCSTTKNMQVGLDANRGIGLISHSLPPALCRDHNSPSLSQSASNSQLPFDQSLSPVPSVQPVVAGDWNPTRPC